MKKLTSYQEKLLRGAEAASLPGDGLRVKGSGAHRAARGLESLGLARLAVPGDGSKARLHVTKSGRAMVDLLKHDIHPQVRERHQPLVTTAMLDVDED